MTEDDEEQTLKQYMKPSLQYPIAARLRTIAGFTFHGIIFICRVIVFQHCVQSLGLIDSCLMFPFLYAHLSLVSPNLSLLITFS